MRSGSYRSCEERYVRAKSGRYVPVSIRASMARGENGRAFSRTMWRDITPIKQAEHALAYKAQALERSNDELQQFAYVASHDLQEPLRMVTSYLQLIERRYGTLLDDSGREFFGFAVDGAERMKHH